MRLVCPNCGAQYEVPSEVIPANGRDVQCSNCGDTWFQRHPDEIAAEEAEAQAAETAAAAPPPADVPEPEPEISAEPEPEPEPERPLAPPAEDAGAARRRLAMPDDDEEYEESDPGPVPASAVAARAREIDPKVRDVLREEALREAKVRSREAEGLESQPDLGLDDPAPRGARPAAPAEKPAVVPAAQPAATVATAPVAVTPTRPEPARPAATVRKRPEPAPTEQPAEKALTQEEAAASRRDLLPDIEEINSSLRTKGEKKAPPPVDDQTAVLEKRRGFRIGFGLTLLLTALLILLYLKADEVIAAAPGTRSAVESYVAVANDLRFWLDGMVGNLVAWLDGMVGAE